ncbi:MULTISPECIES: cation:proton antiporter regulatory subunit [Fictibacillus]|uniref:Potassium transporter n=1 Tax=Fictibacillus enclensis TaxID=1017270 RepID=A0A0V8JC21_9BACL|nr:MULTISPECIES: cation:proton antiporter regulatory subunit [Fictibacillus]KSU84428.1 potassium transporter [Fictibacillus enclensis]RXY99939.1 potassium transporter [Fictibacillus sp. S7]SCB79289.1 potassium/proton antiporter regulatory subunit, CPA2 family (TC 2.A.37.5.2) [Fictibacillus enclensis]
MDIREGELPGIGRKFEIITKAGEKIVVVIHDDGRRELYHFDSDHEESISSVTFNDSEARQIASIIGGMVYKPQAIESMEMALEGLVIEWYKVEAQASAIGATIGGIDIRNKYNVTVIAMLKKNMKKLFNPGPETFIEAGDMLVLSGERHDLKKLISDRLST